ncbi:MAG: 23S rRNA (guanosine(2251)-2'-O)-methyltransferase RlmB [Clostridia bacterium]|nr:23S rRNA (guanosine(2251)-2'-O)-methyltransferase RlmB [Clostridia bacterium]
MDRKYDKKNSYKSHGNARVGRDREYSASESYDELSENLICGRNAVKELLSSGRDIEKIYVQSGEREGSVNLLIGMAAERKIRIVDADKRKLDELSRGERHQGIVAIAAGRNYYSVDDILEYARERGEKPFIVILDGVEDPHNLGAVIRSAECCGVHGVIIPKRRAVGLTSTAVKASAGAAEYVRVAKVTNLAMTIDYLKEQGLWLFAADMGGESYYKTDMTCPTAVVLGSEGFGISRLVKEKCDITVSIPLYGNVNSMNVSCAAAVILAEVAKQRNS